MKLDGPLCHAKENTCLTLSISANAALVDMGDFTRDTATSLDWLDIDLTVQMTRDQVLASEYVVDQGYRYATLSELNTLYDNAGGNGYYLNEAGVPNPENNSVALLLIELMGCTSIILGSPCNEVGGWGAAMWGAYPGSPELQVGIVAVGGAIWTDWWTTVAIETRDDYGSYLVKTNTVTLIVSEGQLLGARDVNVGGTLYDVEFKDGFCSEVFSGCNSESLAFNTVSQAITASHALLDQVFLDQPAGNFDTDPTLTRGCGSGNPCSAMTAYAILPNPPYEDQFWLADARNGSELADSVADTLTFSVNASPSNGGTWAVWSVAEVPTTAADINIVAIESGGDVVISASGSIDLTGLTLTGSVSLTSAISPNTGELWLGGSVGTTYAGFSPAPAPFGSGSQTSGTAFSTFLFGIIGGDLLVPNGYVSNSQLGPVSNIWFGSSFASLGMDVGSYLYTLTNGQTVSLEISADADGDGVTDDLDNCILVANPTQCDGDGDNYGNHCDGDFNNDLIVNGLDIGFFKISFGTADPVADLNCDGITNGLDIGVLKSQFGQSPGPSGLVP